MVAMTDCVCDPVGMTSERPHDTSCVCVHDQNSKVLAYYTQHGAEGQGGEGREERKESVEGEGGNFSVIKRVYLSLWRVMEVVGDTRFKEWSRDFVGKDQN